MLASRTASCPEEAVLHGGLAEPILTSRGGDGSDADGSGNDGAREAVSGYGLRVLPANPPPYRRFQPVYGEVKPPAEGADAPVAALGAF